ncbi:MAG: RNA-binding protein [Paludibacteraceae bacterium]|nr:RNA-binding protein [Paludibacteraceae bacterium]
MNIFVSNLSYAVTDADLCELFKEYGEVSSAKVILDRETQKSRGFGFVEMPDDEAARKAISELEGGEFDGRTIHIKEAQPREERRPSGGPRGNFRGPRRQSFQ